MLSYHLGPRSKSRHPADDRYGGAEDPYGHADTTAEPSDGDGGI
jgi:hypothetical protein